MDPKEINETFLKNLPENLSYEKKNVILMGDFNNDILQNDAKVSEYFLDKMYSNFFLTYISMPSSVTSRSKHILKFL